MFSGIIEGRGIVQTVSTRDGAMRLEIRADFPLGDMNVGDSIAVNGCCLTVTSRLGHTFWADLASETVRVTTLGSLRVDDRVNLERALTYGGRVGGHLVQGHIDGVGQIVEIVRHEGSLEVTIAVPIPLTRYMIKRGSVAVDGVSLTIANCQADRITAFIIPHTEKQTIFNDLFVGRVVNLEADLVGKYLEKLAEGRIQGAYNYEFGASFLKKPWS